MLLEPAPASSRWRSSLSPDDFAALVAERALLRDGPFTLTWKLSGAGIVGRVMDLPPTDKALVGRATPFGFELAAAPDATHRHAFEPIAEIRVAPDGRGARVDLHLRLHREQRSFALPFALTGLACLAGAVFAAAPLQAGMSALVGAAFVVLPPMRSRALFRHGVARAEAAMTEALGLERAD